MARTLENAQYTFSFRSGLVGLKSIFRLEAFVTQWTRVDKALIPQVLGLDMLPEPGPVLGGPVALTTLPQIPRLDHPRFNPVLNICWKLYVF